MKNATQTSMSLALTSALAGRKLANAPKSEVAKVEKAPNYTPEQTAKMLGMYCADKTQVTVEKIALEMGKTVRSVVAKLSREKVYIAKEYKTKTGEKVVKKDEHADAIGAILKLRENDIESLTKCTKPALVAIFKALAMSVPLTPENDKALMDAGEFQNGDAE